MSRSYMLKYSFTMKKGVSMSIETIIIFIIILVALALILFFILSNYTNLFTSLSQQTNATTSLANSIQINKP